MTDLAREEAAGVPACPHPEWGAADLVRRARELVPLLRSRLERGEAEGRLPEETNGEFLDAGFYRLLQPRRFGGYEAGVPTFAKVIMEISRGCPSSGWVLSLTAGHAILLSAFFPEQAQVEAYGPDGDFRGPSSTGPRGGARGDPVDGGYVVDGEWDYASGIDVSTHYFAGVTVPGAEGSMQCIALLERGDYTIVDNWRVLGMRGTGSRRVVARGVFVPAHRVIPRPRDAVFARTAPGRQVHRNPIYRAGRLTSLLLEEMAAVAVGVARGMLDLYEEEVAVRRVTTPAVLAGGAGTRGESPETWRRYGQAWAMIQMAEATVLKVAEDYEEFARQDAEQGIPFSDERDTELQVLEQHATKLAVDAAHLLFESGGTTSAQEGSALGRFFRDMAVLSTHNAAQYERGAETLGRLHLGASS